MKLASVFLQLYREEQPKVSRHEDIEDCSSFISAFSAGEIFLQQNKPGDRILYENSIFNFSSLRG